MKYPLGLTIPSDIKPLIEKLKQVKRFVNSHYPPTMFADNVYMHTCRCVTLAEALAPLFHEPDFPIDLPLLKRILWIHDLVEIGMKADIPAPDKAVNEELLAKVEKEEYEKARHLLTDVDLGLWEEFEKAKNVLMGNDSHQEVLVEAILARIIDVLDGSILFNRSLVRWLKEKVSLSLRLPNYALLYSFQTNRQYDEVINNRKEWQSLRFLLHAERDMICTIWQDVPPTRIPPAIRLYLAN